MVFNVKRAPGDDLELLRCLGVDCGPIVEATFPGNCRRCVGKVLDFVAAPRFDTVADSLKVGFIGLAIDIGVDATASTGEPETFDTY